METAEYFACLNYGQIEILIPQFCIQESDYVGKNRLLSEEHHCHHVQSFLIDSFIENLFNIKPSAQLEKIRTHLEIHPDGTESHFEIRTGLIPKVIQIPWCEIKLLGEDLEGYMAPRGIVGLRFQDDIIQYVTDPEQLYSISRKNGADQNA